MPGLKTVIGVQGSCRPLSLKDLKPSGSSAGNSFVPYTIALDAFDFNKPADQFKADADFNGCGGNGNWDANTIEIRNFRWWSQWACIDEVYLQ